MWTKRPENQSLNSRKVRKMRENSFPWHQSGFNEKKSSNRTWRRVRRDGTLRSIRRWGLIFWIKWGEDTFGSAEDDIKPEGWPRVEFNAASNIKCRLITRFSIIPPSVHIPNFPTFFRKNRKLGNINFWTNFSITFFVILFEYEASCHPRHPTRLDCLNKNRPKSLLTPSVSTFRFSNNRLLLNQEATTKTAHRLTVRWFFKFTAPQ